MNLLSDDKKTKAKKQYDYVTDARHELSAKRTENPKDNVALPKNKLTFE